VAVSSASTNRRASAGHDGTSGQVLAAGQRQSAFHGGPRAREAAVGQGVTVKAVARIDLPNDGGFEAHDEIQPRSGHGGHVETLPWWIVCS
jgi:hypothetical protein